MHKSIMIKGSQSKLQAIWVTLKNLQKCQIWLIEFQEVFFCAKKSSRSRPSSVNFSENLH